MDKKYRMRVTTVSGASYVDTKWITKEESLNVIDFITNMGYPSMDHLEIGIHDGKLIINPSNIETISFIDY